MKSYIVHFYTTDEQGDNILITSAVGVGENAGDAVKSARRAIISEYPLVSSSLWVAMKHHMKLTPGKLPEPQP